MEDTRSNQSKTSSIKIFADWSFQCRQDVERVSSHKHADMIANSIDDKKAELIIPSQEVRVEILKSNFNIHIEQQISQSKKDKKLWLDVLKKSTQNQSSILNIMSQLRSASTIAEFLTNQTGQSNLSMVSSLHLITHRKGELSAFHVSQANDKKRISVEDFNEIFHTVKKSKQTTFAESLLKSSQIKIVGTCLAKAASFKTHNFIVIGTRNEFIPYDQEDIEAFNTFCQVTLPIFDHILRDKTESLLQQRLQEVLEHVEGESLHFKKIHSEFHHQRISLLGELLNTLRHELSNPLFGIQLSASLLTEEFQVEDDKEMANQIQEAVTKSLTILNGFSKLYGPLNELQKVSLVQLINEVFTLTKSETKMILRDIKIKKMLGEQKEDVQITTNPTSLSQIFFNLILNSSQAMQDQIDPKPQINIEIERELTDVKIIFSDNGPGIPQAIQENIFDSFYTTKETGTGLGLSICRNLVRKLGGDMWCVKSDKGAQFVLVLQYEGTPS